MWSTNSIFVVFLLTGFTVGFGHCIGMCGPIVISLSLQLRDRPSLWPHLFYNLGRTATYGVLGAIAGGTASFTRFAQSIGGLQKGIMIAAGVLIVFMGLSMAGWIPSGLIFRNGPPVGQFINRIFKRFIHRESRSPVYFPLGMVLGLLPCGPVYTAMIAAARSGMESSGTFTAILSGTGIMVSFGLGTIPALFLLSRISNIRWLKHREVIYRIGAVMMIGMGLYFVWKGFTY
jgi:sulfite exporter TauE/SafE